MTAKKQTLVEFGKELQQKLRKTSFKKFSNLKLKGGDQLYIYVAVGQEVPEGLHVSSGIFGAANPSFIRDALTKQIESHVRSQLKKGATDPFYHMLGGAMNEMEKLDRKLDQSLKSLRSKKGKK